MGGHVAGFGERHDRDRGARRSPAVAIPTKTQWRTDRARMAVYLMASSYFFQVQH